MRRWIKAWGGSEISKTDCVKIGPMSDIGGTASCCLKSKLNTLVSPISEVKYRSKLLVTTDRNGCLIIQMPITQR